MLPAPPDPALWPPDAPWAPAPDPLPAERIGPARTEVLAAMRRAAAADPSLFPPLATAEQAGADPLSPDAWRLAAAEGVETLLTLDAARSGDAAAFPGLMRAQMRADSLRAALEDVGEILFDAGLNAAVLKGGAWLLAARPAPALRGMTDLDLLVAPQDLPQAVAALRAAGWTGDHAAHSPRTDYQYPALFPPKGIGPATLELHVRLEWAHGGPLAPEAVLSRATPAGARGLLLPAAADRAAHLIRHAQLADRRHAMGVARLRDALDWRRLAGDPAMPEPDELVVLAGWVGPRARAAAEAFLVLQARLWGGEADLPEGWAARHFFWVESAFASIGDLQAKAAAARRDRPMRLLAALADPALRRHLMAGALRPARRRRFLARLGLAPRPDPRGEG